MYIDNSNGTYPFTQQKNSIDSIDSVNKWIDLSTFMWMGEFMHTFLFHPKVTLSVGDHFLDQNWNQVSNLSMNNRFFLQNLYKNANIASLVLTMLLEINKTDEIWSLEM